MLNISPFRNPKITRYIAYKFKYKYNDPYFIYRLCDTKTGKVVGRMKAGPEYIDNMSRPFSPNADTYKSFYIYNLKVLPEYQKHGAGTALINIAKKESVRELCSGNLHLISHNTRTPINMPHLFYRKNGFSCNKYHKSSQDYFDKCIEKGEPITKSCFTKIPMYIEKCVKNQDKNIEMWYNLKFKNPKLFDFLCNSF